jgi:mannose-1-phosphate guanylyltransferase/mannose-6-phosphate isomerase
MAEPKAVLPVVLAGGSGTRLWPLSRELYPKQFLKLAGEHSLLQSTLTRLVGIDHLPPYLVCNDEHRFLAAEQCRAIGVRWGAILLEPKGRSTAPAIALAALQAVRSDADPTLLVLPADHVIADTAAFTRAVAQGAALVADGGLLTFAVVPDRAETGYGYIRSGAAVDGGGFRVAEFVEKPNAETAARYLASGDYAWNSGMFMFKARSFLAELERFRPDILTAVQGAFESMQGDLDFLRPGPEFATSPAESIDYAVMERTDRALVLPIDVGWSDVGSFEALLAVTERDAHGNSHRGDVIDIDSRDSLVIAQSRLVATLGLEGVVVIETADAVLVAANDRTQDVKRIVDTIKASGRSEHQLHRRVYRPWGSYETIAAAERYQVKLITVNPGAALSLQMHHHRSEHWIVVRGTARVVCGDSDSVLHENESTYIPIGTRHRLANPGKIPLKLIEVQAGSYLGEDDIVRFEDAYGRG